MHQVIDMSRFLAILGPQTIQLTVRYRDRPLSSYIVQTTGNTVEYIRIINGKQEQATISLDLNFDFDQLEGNSYSSFELMKGSVRNYLYHVFKPLTVGDVHETLNMIKFTLAVCAEIIPAFAPRIFHRSKDRSSRHIKI